MCIGLLHESRDYSSFSLSFQMSVPRPFSLVLKVDAEPAFPLDTACIICSVCRTTSLIRGAEYCFIS